MFRNFNKNNNFFWNTWPTLVLHHHIWDVDNRKSLAKTLKWITDYQNSCGRLIDWWTNRCSSECHQNPYPNKAEWIDGLILFIKRNFEYGKDVLQISTTYFSVIWSRNMRNAIYIYHKDQKIKSSFYCLQWLQRPKNSLWQWWDCLCSLLIRVWLSNGCKINLVLDNSIKMHHKHPSGSGWWLNSDFTNVMVRFSKLPLAAF